MLFTRLFQLRHCYKHQHYSPPSILISTTLKNKKVTFASSFWKTRRNIMTTSKMNQEELTVAVIGGGPGGMFFIHHVLHHMKQSDSKYDVKITCYERTSRPGGVWRSPIHSSSTSNGNNSSSDDNTNANVITTGNKLHAETDMYDQLWTNGPCHGIEYSDYTYEEHFNNQPIHAYLKRQELLEYITGRVTKNRPHFFDEYFHFNTEVIHVKYDSTIQKFTIQVKDLISGITSTNQFDKCVWACGLCGKQYIPQSTLDILQLGNYSGKIMHSSQTELLERDVRDKRILLLGGEYSAEDMALQSIKLGVKKVYIVSRLADSYVALTTAWPYNKVEVILGKDVKAVVNNGNCIQLRDVEWTYNGYEPVNDNEVTMEIEDIDTVIFCTGYKPCLQMLDDELNQGLPGSHSYFHNKYVLEQPAPSWEMKSNSLTEYMGTHVELCSQLKYVTDFVHPNFYHGLLISNPNMMFMSDYENLYPLLGIDAHAWFFARIVTGIQSIPNVEDMKQYNLQKSYEMLNNPYYRMLMDENYCNTMLKLPNYWPADDDDNAESPESYTIASNEAIKYTFSLLAQFMYENQHPMQLWDIVNQTLNNNGELLCLYSYRSDKDRSILEEYIDDHDDENEWNTFDQTYRDYKDGHDYKSILTGKACIPLPKKWLDMNE